jgi:hypothetical protein
MLRYNYFVISYSNNAKNLNLICFVLGTLLFTGDFTPEHKADLMSYPESISLRIQLPRNRSFGASLAVACVFRKSLAINQSEVDLLDAILPREATSGNALRCAANDDGKLSDAALLNLDLPSIS